MKRRAWLITYRYTKKTRVVWAEFREVLPSGAMVFYDTSPELSGVDFLKATEHIYAVGQGVWLDVILNPTNTTGDLETLGKPEQGVWKPKKTRGN